VIYHHYMEELSVVAFWTPFSVCDAKIDKIVYAIYMSTLARLEAMLAKSIVRG